MIEEFSIYSLSKETNVWYLKTSYGNNIETFPEVASIKLLISSQITKRRRPFSVIV
jgi:hypothetical protein